VRWRRIGELVCRLAAGAPWWSGIARHPDGTPHEVTARCERFARQLEGRLPAAGGAGGRALLVGGAAGGRDDDRRGDPQQWFDEATMIELDAEAVYRSLAARLRER